MFLNKLFQRRQNNLERDELILKELCIIKLKNQLSVYQNQYNILYNDYEKIKTENEILHNLTFLEEIKECCICFEDKKMKKLICNHEFCFDCIKKEFTNKKSQNKCPLCRKIVYYKFN